VLNSSYIHGLNIEKKKSKPGYPKILDEIETKYKNWREKTEKLNSEIEEELKRKVSLLNEYKDYLDSVSRYFKPLRV